MIASTRTATLVRSVNSRPTRWWRAALERRRAERDREGVAFDEPVVFRTEEERRAALKFFNAAYRAEESGLRQAHELAEEVGQWDAELAAVLRLYGDEEGWHRELLTAFLTHLGGGVQPMGRVTRAFYSLYGRAHRMETIVLTNLMFETIGSTTYRMTLRRVSNPSLRRMLTILTRDEAFHVPLNAHFLKCVLARTAERDVKRLQWIYRLLFASLVALPLASRPKARAFDGIGTLELSRAYALELSRLFDGDAELPFTPPRVLLRLLGIRTTERKVAAPTATSVLAAEAAVDRAQVEVLTASNDE